MQPTTCNEILTHAGRAIHKVERLGKRGLSRVTEAETEALILLAVTQGIPPVAPDERVSDAVKTPVKAPLTAMLLAYGPSESV